MPSLKKSKVKCLIIEQPAVIRRAVYVHATDSPENIEQFIVAQSPGLQDANDLVLSTAGWRIAE